MPDPTLEYFLEIIEQIRFRDYAFLIFGTAEDGYNRYGVSSRGKEKAHYAGYKALPSAEGKTTSRTAAAEFIAKHSGVPVKEILFSNTALTTAYRKAAQKLHPDKTNNTEEFAKLTEAKQILDTLTETAAAGGQG